MALSEQEQRLLDQLEASLVEEDPKLAHMMSGSVHRRPIDTKRGALGVIGFVLGMGLLIGGIQLFWPISILGFAVMVVSATYGLGLWGGQPKLRSTRTEGTGGPRGSSPQTAPGTPIMDKFEERWRRRQHGGQ